MEGGEAKGEGKREREGESQAVSTLSMGPNTGLDPTALGS